MNRRALRRTLLRAASLASIAAALVAAPGSARADELTLDETVRSAIANHPVLAAAEQERSIAAGDLLSAEGGFDPSVRGRAMTIPFGPYTNDRVETMVEQPTAIWGARLFGGWRYGRGSFAPYDGKLETADLGEVRAGLAVPVLRDGPIDRRRASIARAELGRTLAGLSIEQQKLELARAASHRYWDWVAAGRRVAIARELLAIAVTRDAALKARSEQGDLPAYERIENERAVQQRTAQVAAAQRGLENASIELSLFFRSASGEPRLPEVSRLPQALAEPTGLDATSTATDERLALERRPEPKRFEATARQAGVEYDLAKNQQKLGLDLGVAGAKDIGQARDPNMLKPELELWALLDVPILNRVNDGRAQSAEAARARATHQARFAKDRVVADVRDAASAMEQARRRFAAARREVEVARDLVKLEQQRFELGEGTLLIVNLREQALGEAQLREVEAAAEFHKAVASRAAATGTTPRR